MGACLSAPKPATDGPSVSARSARTFGVAPVQTAKSDVESSGEMVEVPLDTPPAAASGAGKGSGFGSFLQAKVTVDPRSAEDARDAPSKPSEDANGAAHRVRGALVPERGRIDQALVDDMDAAVASALEGSDDKAAEPGFSADRVASAEAEAAAAREQDVSLVLSDDPSEEATFSDSGEGDEEEDDDSDEYETDASSAEEDEGEDAHRSGSTEDATGEAIEDVTEDVIDEATEEVTDDAPAIAPATAPAANAPAAIAPPPAADASDDAPTPVPATPEQTRADAYDFEDSLSVVDMGPVSDSEASGSEYDSAASDGDGDGDEDAPGTEPETATSAGISASTDGSADATVSDTLDEDALGDRETGDVEHVGSAGAQEPRPAVPEETDGGRRRSENDTESSRDDSESSYDSESSSAYGDEGDRFDADAGPRVASTVEAFGSTVDATVTEVRARSKHSPPPTPRVRGAADPESLGATPRSARSGALLSSRSGGSDSFRAGPDSNRSGASEGWTSVVVLYVTSVSAVRRTAGQCQRVRQTLANLGVEFLERDVSMATAYKDELARRIRAATGTTTNGGKEKTRADANDDDNDDDDDGAFGKERDRGKKPSPPGKPPTSSGSSSGSGTNSELVVPCLFVDDAFVGSGEALDVSAGDGSLRALLEERGRVGRARAEKDACVLCAGRKLVVCDRCDGSMRWRVADKKTGAVLGERRCPWCNEVGMQECGACVPAFARTTGGSRGGR